jgi:hypothetical protein
LRPAHISGRRGDPCRRVPRPGTRARCTSSPLPALPLPISPVRASPIRSRCPWPRLAGPPQLLSRVVRRRQVEQPRRAPITGQPRARGTFLDPP